MDVFCESSMQLIASVLIRTGLFSFSVYFLKFPR